MSTSTPSGGRRPVCLEDEHTLARAIDLRLGLQVSLFQLGEIARMRECLDEARALAERAGDERRLGWVLANLAPPLRAVGEHQLAVEATERALSIGKSCGDPLLEIYVNFEMAVSLLNLGAYQRAIGVLEPNVGPAAIELYLAEGRALRFKLDVESRSR